MILESRKVFSEDGNYLAELNENYPGISLTRKYNTDHFIYIYLKEIPELIKFLQDIRDDDENDPY